MATTSTTGECMPLSRALASCRSISVSHQVQNIPVSYQGIALAIP